MPKITTRAGLVVGTMLLMDESNRTFQLVEVGGFTFKDGVSIQTLTNKFVDLWATATYQDSPFPSNTIDAKSGQYEFGIDAGANANGWKPFDDNTRSAMKDGGWKEFDDAGVLTREYAGVVGLGSVNVGAQLYYQKTPSGAPVNFTFDDQCNQGVQVFGDVNNGNFDDRVFFKAFVREQGKKFKDSVLADTGATETGAYIVNMLLSNEDDLAISDSVSEMVNAPYSSITIDYFSENQSRNIGGSNYDFNVIINGNGATLEQIYTKVQYLLGQNANINDSGNLGAVIGQTANLLCSLSGTGATLETTLGVFIDNINPADSNRVLFKDVTGVDRKNPFVSSGVLSFNPIMVQVGSSYRLMYTSPDGAGNDYGESGAIVVKDASGTPIAGEITSGTIPFTFDYANDSEASTADTDKLITLIGVAPNFSKFAVAVGVLTESKAISIGLVAETDRAYK